MFRRARRSPLFPYTTLFRSVPVVGLTGTGGAGKSSLTDELLLRLLRQFPRSEEHTSELQSRRDLVCRLLLEKKNAPHLEGARQSQPCQRTALNAWQALCHAA